MRIYRNKGFKIDKLLRTRVIRMTGIQIPLVGIIVLFQALKCDEELLTILSMSRPKLKKNRVMYKVKRFSYISQREYGNAANKAKKNAWVNNQLRFDPRSVNPNSKIGKGLTGGYESKSDTVNHLKSRFQKDIANDIKAGEFTSSDIKSGKVSYSGTGVNELRETRDNLKGTRVQGVHDIASTNINERINSRANGGVTGKQSYTYRQRNIAKENIENRAPKPAQQPKPTSTTTPTAPKPSSTPNTKPNPTNKGLGLGGKVKSIWNSGAKGKAGLIAAGTALAAGTAYGVKKMID